MKAKILLNVQNLSDLLMNSWFNGLLFPNELSNWSFNLCAAKPDLKRTPEMASLVP